LNHLLLVEQCTSSSGLWAVWETRSVLQGVWNTQAAAQVLTAERTRVPHPGTVHSLSSCIRVGFSAEALTNAQRLADAFQQMRSIREPIQQGRGQAFVAEDLGPIGNAYMGGDEHGHLFVHGRAQLKEQVRPSR